MKAMLADVNIQGHLPYLRRLLETLDLWPVLDELGIALVTFPDLGLDRGMDDRPLWNYCQEHELVLFTENRNHDGPNSLYATLMDSWREGCLPVLTIANKGRFEHSPDYAVVVAQDIAELLFGIHSGGYCDQPRIYVPLGRSVSGA